jgi:stage IV sporulation protein FB
VGWSISLGKVKGTAVRVHWTFLLFLIWLGFAAYVAGGVSAAAGAVSFILLLFLCVTLHEFGHILAARQFGVRTPEILLLPIGGVSKLERVPERPKEELIMAAAGPAVTFVIAALLLLIVGELPQAESVFKFTSPRGIIAQLALANITLFVFNLLPAFPLDGGRILRAILSHFHGHLRGTQLAAAIGKVAAVVLGIFALSMGHIILLLIAMFIFIAAGTEAGMEEIRGMLARVPAHEVMITDFRSLPATARMADAAEDLIRTNQTEFPVVDSTGALIGLLDRDGIVKSLAEGGADTPVASAMRTNVPVVTEWHRLDDGLELLQGGARAIAVTDASGQPTGLITLENLAEQLMIVRPSEKRTVRLQRQARQLQDDPAAQN